MSNEHKQQQQDTEKISGTQYSAGKQCKRQCPGTCAEYGESAGIRKSPTGTACRTASRKCTGSAGSVSGARAGSAGTAGYGTAYNTVTAWYRDTEYRIVTAQYTGTAYHTGTAQCIGTA